MSVVQVRIPEPTTIKLTPVTYGSGVKVEIFTKELLVTNTVDGEWGEHIGTSVGKHINRFYETYYQAQELKKAAGKNE